MALPYSVRITDGTSTIVDFTGTIRVLSYTPLAGDPEPSMAPATEAEGARLLALALPNIVEPLRFAVLGSLAAARTAERAIETALRRAAAWSLRRESVQLYWEVQLQAGDGYWQSPLVRGHLAPSTDPLPYAQQILGESYVYELVIERAPYFDGPLTAVPLSNGNGTNTTSPITVRNHDDSGAGDDTFVAIGSSGVTGALPTPAELAITSTTADSIRTYDLFVGHNVWSSPATFAPVLEAESATPLQASSAISNSGYSGGAGTSMTWSGTGELGLLRFPLSSALLAACAGQRFRVFLRLGQSPASSSIWARVETQLFDLTTLEEGEQQQLTQGLELHDLGELQLPPYLVGETSVQPLSILLSAQNYTGAGGGTLQMDYLYLMPLASWRRYRPRAVSRSVTPFAMP